MSAMDRLRLEAKYRAWSFAMGAAGAFVRTQSRIRRALYPGKEDGLDTVVLLHGLWMGSSCMRVLARCYAAAGYRVVFIDYQCSAEPATVYRAIQRSAVRAASLGSRVHLVGHSCGGVLAVSAWLESQGDLDVESILCLGAPLNGSQAARELLGHPAGQRTLGRTGGILCAPIARERPRHGVRQPRIAMLAGTRANGAARWLGVIGKDSDGMVEIAETRWAGLDQHVALDCTHRGLVHRRHVAAIAVAFTSGSALADVASPRLNRAPAGDAGRTSHG